MKLYIDIETVGLNGPTKLIQYSVDRGPVQLLRLYRDWPYVSFCRELKQLGEHLFDPNCTVIGYNLSFDLYHLYRVFHELWHGDLKSRRNTVPPFNANVLDLYTHAVRNGPLAPWAFSRSSGRRVAVVRRIPRTAMTLVADRVELELRRHLPNGVKAVRSEHTVKGKPELVTLSWVASASLSLKTHARHYGAKTQQIDDVWPLPPREIEKPWLPYYGPEYTPFEDACERVMRGDGTPKGEAARAAFERYATDDIEFLWLVEDGLNRPAPDHHDTSVAIVAYTRYHGFDLDRNVLTRTRDAYASEVREAETLLTGINLRSSKQKLEALKRHEPWLAACNKNVLTAIIRDGQSEAVPLARAMLQYSKAKQRLDQVNKLLECETGRAHPSLRVMGTATGRMAGADGFNFQGIAQAQRLPDGTRIGIRAAMKAALGGDFSSFEVAIAASAWNDTQLLADLDNGTDVHLMTAVTCHPDLVRLGLDYNTAKAVRKDKGHEHHDVVERARSECKRIVFGLLYGAGPEKVEEVLGLPPGQGEQILTRFFGRYTGLGAFRKREEQRFLTADTERWDAESVARMARDAHDLIGFVRRFDFECDTANALWRLGHGGLKTGLTGTVVRSEEKGPQTIDNACRSAFLGAALTIQQAVCRQAINMPIQSTGANLCKLLAAEIWDALHVPMLNVHDEIVFPAHPNLNIERVFEIVRRFEERYRPRVRHIAFDLKPVDVWADKA